MKIKLKLPHFHGGDSHPEMSSSPGIVGLARAHPLTKTQAFYGAFPPDSARLRSTLPVGALVVMLLPVSGKSGKITLLLLVR